jgi:molybdopterin-guanine dinucleotide biosynthesis protein B
MRRMLAVLGFKNSGKTYTIEVLTRSLVEKGCQVAVFKHVPSKNFTIDTRGKDTWRYSQSGAGTVVCVAPKEITYINKIDTSKLSLNDITKPIKNRADLMIFEGFRELMEKEPRLPKIVCIKNLEELKDWMKIIKNIIATVGQNEVRPTVQGIPHFKLPTEKKEFISCITEKICLKKQF